jgi:hypothetical protein
MRTNTRILLAAVAVGSLLTAPVLAQEVAVAPAHIETVKRIMDSPGYKTAVDALQKDHARWIDEVIKITEIPAPPSRKRFVPKRIWKCSRPMA